MRGRSSQNPEREAGTVPDLDCLMPLQQSVMNDETKYSLCGTFNNVLRKDNFRKSRLMRIVCAILSRHCMSEGDQDVAEIL